MEPQDFVKKFEKDLLCLIHQEKSQHGLGLLYVNMNNQDKVDCAYLPINHPELDNKIRMQILDFYEKKKSEVYLYIIKGENATFMTLDLENNTNLPETIPRKKEETKEEETK